MNREQLQSYIYTEKLLAQLYRQAAAMATLQSERQVLLAFARDAEQNANFDPMIPEGNIQGTYRDLLNEIQKQELASYLELRKLTYNQGNIELRETIRAITDVKLGHILTLLAIVTNMNTPGEERSQKFFK